MGIKIINSFDLNSPLPLDARAVANNINEMNELITKNFVVAGQMCYNKADNKLYVLKKNSEGALLSWHEVADSVDLDNINKVLPTDIAVKDNKLGLEHDNVWLTNQNAINLGDNMTYDETTKTLNAKGGGSGGESVSPTLNLMDLEEGTVRTTITEQEKLNLDKGLYNQVYYGDLTSENPFELYTPSKIYNLEGGLAFINFNTPKMINNKAVFETVSLYSLGIGTKNTNGEYPITIINQFSFNLGSGGGSSQPLELSGTFDASTPSQPFKDITLTDEQVATIKSKYENKEPLIVRVKYFPIENMGYAFDIQNIWAGVVTENNVKEYQFETLMSLDLGNKTVNFVITIDTSTKRLSCKRHNLLNENETSLIFDSEGALKISSSGVVTPTYVGEGIYVDTINNKPILHEDSTINNYTIPTITFED